MVMISLIKTIALSRKKHLWPVFVIIALVLGLASPVLADDLDNWHWYDSSPHSNNIRSVTYGNNTLVKVGVPTRLSAKTISSTEIDLTWKGVTGCTYNIYRSENKDGGYELIQGAENLKDTFYKDTGLLNETIYWYQVTALNSANVESAASSSVSASTKGPGPTGLTLNVAGSSQIDISWAGVAGATSYNIYQATKENGLFTKVGKAKSAVTETITFKKLSLKPSTAYWYKVTAVTAAGEGDYSEVVTAVTMAMAPTSLRAKTISSTEIDLTWKGVAGCTYNIYRSTIKEGEYTKIAPGLGNSSYNDNNLTPITTYWYKVSEINPAGFESAASLAVSAVTKAAGPMNLISQTASNNEIDLSWDAVDGAKTYKVYRASSEKGSYVKVGTSKTTNFKDSKLIAGTTYWYKVTAVTSSGEGDYSGPSMATTLPVSNDILIGGNLELTGISSQFGQPAKNAIELAFQQVNDQGGILNGRKFKLIAEDNKSVDNEVETAATKLIAQDKVVGIIGPLTSPGTKAEISVATKNHVPVITPSGSAPELTVNDNGQLNKWIFRACFIDPVQAKAAAQFALGEKIKAKTAAVIIVQENSSWYSQPLATIFVQAFTKGGGQIVNEQYAAGTDNLSTILANIEKAKPDVIYLPGFYQEAGEIIRQARDLGLNMPFIGGDGWANTDIYKIAGVQAMNNSYYTDHVALDDPAMLQFIADYQAKYGEMLDAWPALAYDAAKMFVRAIEIAGGTDTKKIRDALENLKDLQGVSGNITVDPATHNPARSVFIMENKEGKAVFVTKIDPN